MENSSVPLTRRFTAADIPAAMALVRENGWNQTAADWERFLAAQPGGSFAAVDGDRLVGTVATIVYEGRLAWLGMMLVDAGYRGRGVGRQLLARALDFLDGLKVPSVKLDATPAGKPLYEKLGFVAECEIERHQLARELSTRPGRWSPGSSDPGQIRRLTKAEGPGLHDSHIDAIMSLDKMLAGIDRGDVLRSLAAAAPELAVAVIDDHEVAGYAFGRHGDRADHLGPWMARDADSAARVLTSFLARSDRPLVFVDCVRDNPWSRDVARAHGFELVRGLTRMSRGVNEILQSTKYLGGILGPEFG